jgi:hypothetical protein
MAKQVTFSNRVHARWGLPADKKILWTMSDEKWWHGMVTLALSLRCAQSWELNTRLLQYIIKVI